MYVVKWGVLGAKLLLVLYKTLPIFINAMNGYFLLVNSLAYLDLVASQHNQSHIAFGMKLAAAISN